MIDAIKNFFTETVGPYWSVFFCSMLPIIELRGAIPMGAALGLRWWQNYLLRVSGNMLAVPLAGWVNRKAEKNRPRIERYSFWGVALFVAIPLPVTGAWTGSLVAATIEMRFWKALLSAFIGVLVAGCIMTLASYGVVAAFQIFA